VIIKSKTTTYRVQCKAPWDAMPWGCSDLGPRGFSAQEAKELALVRDWENRRGKWICPGHLRTQGKEAT